MSLIFLSCLFCFCYKKWRRQGRSFSRQGNNLSRRAIPSPAAWLSGSSHVGRQASGEHMGTELLTATDAHDMQMDGVDGATASLLAHVTSRIESSAVGAPVGSTPAGNYVGVYWQYGHCHPLAAQHLSCTLSADGTSGSAGGHGTDDVGGFNVRGSFRAARLALTKQYVRGTGNPRENKGHAVELRLVCCALEAALPERVLELRRWGMPPAAVGFFGTWHVRTANYRGDAEMVLWLPPQPVPVGFIIAQTSEPHMVGLPPAGHPHMPPPGMAPDCGAPLEPAIPMGQPAIPMGQPLTKEVPMAAAIPMATAMPIAPAAPMQAAAPRFDGQTGQLVDQLIRPAASGPVPMATVRPV